MGSFAMTAARGGAREVRAIDANVFTLEVGAECARANGLHTGIHCERKDASKALQGSGQGGGCDIVVLDPSRLVPSKAACVCVQSLRKTGGTWMLRCASVGGSAVLFMLGCVRC
ncbi:hypothetical protein [Pajaroellobacter abortibovis]|uniref:hypothetical protein n=1 Tax=Pajaroellobacter abortibovis TaxID=1882918 RepID=UPI0012EB4AE7|nr:hypothetical protein [Pajaroellobacter abortibovis]